MPSLPSSLRPTMTRSPFLRFRLSTTERLPSAFQTMQLSMRLSSARRQRPSSFTYSGYMEVLWKFSGATPSRSTARKAASGAERNSGRVKSGAVYVGMTKSMAIPSLVFLFYYSKKT